MAAMAKFGIPTRSVPLSFAPTRTGPKNSKFMALTLGRPDYILPRPDRTETIYHQPEIHIHVSDYNKHVNMPCNQVITSYIQHANDQE